MLTANERERASLGCLGEAYRLWEHAGPLWPGWDFPSTPLLIVGETRSFLAGTDRPPPGFRAVQSPLPVPLYCGPLPRAGALAAAVVPMGALDLQRPGGAVDFLGLVLREAFAVHRARHGAMPAYPQALCRYPETSAPNNVLSRIEGLLLHELLTGDEPDHAGLRLAFALVRRERREALDDDLVVGEKICELRLGLGRYLEVRAWKAALAGGFCPSPAFRALTGSGPIFEPALAARYEGLRNTCRGVLRERFAYTGMALALCLDRLHPGWPEELAPHVFLDDLFERFVSFDGGDGDEAALLQAKERHGYFENLVAEREWVRRLHARREGLLAQTLGADGLRMVFDVSALDAPVVIHERAEVEPLGDQVLLYRGPCSFRFGLSTLEFEGVRVLEDRVSGLLQVVTRPGRLRFYGDERPFGLHAPAEFTDGLSLDVPGVKVRARHGVIYDADGVLYVKILD